MSEPGPDRDQHDSGSTGTGPQPPSAPPRGDVEEAAERAEEEVRRAEPGPGAPMQHGENR